MWADERRDPFESVLPKCPMERHVSNFPCPGPHRHYLNFYDDNPNAPVGRGEVLCRLFVFSNLRYSKTNAGGGKYLNGTKRLLESVLICAGTCNVELVLNLGGTIDTSNIETNGELQELFEDMRSEFEHSFLKTHHVLGDMEAAVRTQYIHSFFAETARRLDDTRSCVRCCGNTFYKVPIGREYTLIVIDGYELLVVDPKKSELCPNSTNTEETGDGFRLNFPVRDSAGRKCSMHEDANSARVGWPQEMQAKGHFMTAGEKTAMPRLRTAVSKSQLRWLEESLLSCMHNNQNVVVACHAPLHPMLVRDRSTLVLNWREVLRLLMQYPSVRLVLCGRQANEGSDPAPGSLPYTRDHDILYFSVPSVCPTTTLRNSASVHLLADLGYDYVRVRGEGLGLNYRDQEFGCFSAFRPPRKLTLADRDYSFNGALLKGI
ncbi:hypothetical protein SprV_0301035600 [Sparganum proliferum]